MGLGLFSLRGRERRLGRMGLPGGEGAGHDFAMLAGQIAHLACLRLGRVAGRHLAADVGVKMGKGAGAVAVGGDGLVVDVVHWSFVLIPSFTRFVCLSPSKRKDALGCWSRGTRGRTEWS